MVSLVLFLSLCLMAVGLVMLTEHDDDELHEPGPAELSTSAPTVHGCWARLHIRAQQRRPAGQPRRSARPRSRFTSDRADRSAGQRMLAGRISALCSGSGSGPAWTH